MIKTIYVPLDIHVLRMLGYKDAHLSLQIDCKQIFLAEARLVGGGVGLKTSLHIYKIICKTVFQPEIASGYFPASLKLSSGKPISYKTPRQDFYLNPTMKLNKEVSEYERHSVCCVIKF